jgi:pimeloyl-ACP methyl ester carboxylesterase
MQISDSLANAKNIIFKRSGHTPLITEPVKFSQAIRLF